MRSCVSFWQWLWRCKRYLWKAYAWKVSLWWERTDYIGGIEHFLPGTHKLLMHYTILDTLCRFAFCLLRGKNLEAVLFLQVVLDTLCIIILTCLVLEVLWSWMKLSFFRNCIIVVLGPDFIAKHNYFTNISYIMIFAEHKNPEFPQTAIVLCKLLRLGLINT